MKYKRKILISLAVLILLAIAFPFGLRFKLQRDLANYKASLIAKGEKLTIAELIPPMPPASSNGMLKLLSAAGTFTPQNFAWLPSYRYIPTNRGLVCWYYTNHEYWQGTNWWPEILQWRRDNESSLQVITSALESPVLQENVPYHMGHYASDQYTHTLNSAISNLRIAMMADLHEHQPDQAFTNLVLQFKLLQRWQGEPMMDLCRQRIRIFHWAIVATWQFMQYPELKSTHLSALQAEIEKMDFFQGWPKAIEMERAILLTEFADARCNPSSPKSPIKISPKNMPTWDNVKYDLFVSTPWLAWASYQDELLCLKDIQNKLSAIRESAKNRELHAYDIKSTFNENIPYYFRFSHSITDNSFGKFALLSAELHRRIAVCAIALERYYLQHDHYPDALTKLVPDYISSVPLDCMDGNPLRYRLHSNGNYTLYSIGGNKKDDGGIASSLFNVFEEGDFVWPHAPTEDELFCWEQNNELKARSKPRQAGRRVYRRPQ